MKITNVSKHIGFKCIFLLLVICTCETDSDDKNINKLLNNQVIVSRQIMCVLEKSPCDQLGRQLKGEFTSRSVSYYKYFNYENFLNILSIKYNSIYLYIYVYILLYLYTLNFIIFLIYIKLQLI